MTKSYDEEMFDFFTSTDENFLNLCKIARHLPSVKDKLLETFWEEVQNELLRLVTPGGEWKVLRLGTIKGATSKLMLYKTSWGRVDDGCPQLAISYEALAGNTWYGPFIHNHSMELNHAAVVSYLRKLEIASDYEKDNETWYPFFARTGLDFNNDDSYSSILPAKRSETARQFAETLIRLGKDLESKIEYCQEHFLV